MCWRFSAGGRAARPPLRTLSLARACRRGAREPRCAPHSWARPRAAAVRVGAQSGGPRVPVDPASLVLGDPDFNQVAADAVALGERMGRLSAQELLHDLALKLDRMCAVLGHGLSPRKPGSVSRFSGPLPVHPEGCTPNLIDEARALADGRIPLPE